MHGDFKSEHMGFIHDSLHLREIVLLCNCGVGLGEDTARTAKLDHLGTLFAQLAHHGAQFPRSIRDGVCRRPDRWGEPCIITMSAGRSDCVGGRDDPRSRHVPPFDTLLEGNIIKIARSDIANSSKSSLKRTFSIRYTHDGPKIVSELE